MPALAQLGTLVRYARFFRELRAERRTERLIAELPASIRKDIGWPDGYPVRFRMRH